MSTGEHIRDGLHGYRVLGRHGEIGVVVAVASSARNDELLVRGGISESLVYRLPRSRISDIDDRRRAVNVDVEVAEFIPYLQHDGTVHLYLRD